MIHIYIIKPLCDATGARKATRFLRNNHVNMAAFVPLTECQNPYKPSQDALDSNNGNETQDYEVQLTFP